MRLKLEHHSYSQLVDIAEEFLDKYTNKEIPVQIEEIIECDFKVRIIPVQGLQSSCSIDSFISKDLKNITIDEREFNNVPCRYRFSLAHELSHVILHHEIFKDISFSNIETWKKVVTEVDENDYEWLEYQADSLAGLILVPRPNFQKEFDELIGRDALLTKCLANKTAFPKDAIKNYIAEKMGEVFEVSSGVIKHRLRKDSLWPNEKFDFCLD